MSEGGGTSANGHALAGQSGARRLAAIDVGTNSIRLIVAEATGPTTYRVLDDEKAITRLGRGFSVDGLLHEEPMESSVRAIARMKGIAEGYGVERLRCVGTCAVREASNGSAFIEMVRQRAGVVLEPISAEDEATLAHHSVAAAFDLSRLPAAVVDVGGGSTEVVLSSRGAIEEVFTLPLGAVRLTERYGECDADDQRAFEKMRRKVRKVIRERIERLPFVPQVVFGTGGTFTALASVNMQRGAARDGTEALPFAVRGYEMTRADVRHVQDWLRDLPLRSRSRVAGLSPDRAEIIIAGMTIVESVLKALRVNTLRVHDRGIRDGLILRMMGEMFGTPDSAKATPRDRMQAVRQFASACRYEEAHCRHVTGLALSIHEQLSRMRSIPRDAGGKGESDGRCWTSPGSRELLHAAGLLHDIGYLINYAKHHKHSYHLIVHGEMPGFTSREVEIIAHVARYHRRALPSARLHPTFAALPRPDRDLVRKLSAILRLADGFDRTHTQSVAKVSLSQRSGVVHVGVESTSDIGFDLWSAERKGELFERAFGMPIKVEWLNKPERPSPVTEPKPGPQARKHPSRRRSADAEGVRP